MDQTCMVYIIASAAVETFYLKFIKSVLNVKQLTNTCMVYAETGRYPLSIDIKVNMVKQWLKIVCSDQRKLIWIAYVYDKYGKRY